MILNVNFNKGIVQRRKPGYISPVSLLSVLVLVIIAVLLNSCGQKKPLENTEILWDTWGVPHIFAKDARGLFYAFGWSQMESHGDLILHLYAEARGRASEYWGERFLEHDMFMHTMGIPERARQWYNAQGPLFRVYLDEFARGMNDYAQVHLDKITRSLRVVLPVQPEDSLAHLQRVIHIGFIGMYLKKAVKNWHSHPVGSNGWAIAPSRSANNHAMLLANPHLPWYGFYLCYEAQLTAPGIDAYGAALVGMPVLIIAFNDYLGWTHTANLLDGMDLYELNLTGGGYRMDGKVLAFDTRTQTLKVKQKNGGIIEKEFIIRQSIHGPVIEEKKKEGKALAIRLVGLDQPYLWEQYWDMMRATGLEEFEKAVKRLQQPFFNIIYADRDGHIMYLFGGRVPKRPQGDRDYREGFIPGDTSATLWAETHSYEDLPKVKDPPSGWLQNTNDPPWSSTFPVVLNPDDFPSYMSPRKIQFRSQWSINMLHADPKISFAELVQYKHSTRMEMADRILDDLIHAARQSNGPLANKAADVLATWDRKADSHSKGAVLFAAWVDKMGATWEERPEIYARQWKETAPLTTPDGLADPKLAAAALEEVAQRIIDDYGALDIPWGNVYRLRYENIDLPANGGNDNLGIFRAVRFYPEKDKRFCSYYGDSFVAVVEFSNPVKARVLLSYGNSTQLHSAHRGDQLELFVKKKLRPVWRTREEIEKHLEKKENVLPSGVLEMKK